MKEARAIFMFCVGAFVASSWWAAALFGHGGIGPNGDGTGALWFIPGLSTFIVVLAFAIPILANWEKPD